MKAAIQQFREYVQQALGLTVTASPSRQSQRLPYFLRELYAFFEVQLLDVPYLLMVDSSRSEQSPATIRKHMAQVEAKWGAEVIYVRPGVRAYNRKRLVEQKVPFVVPGNQMYLPMLGIDLREHFKKLRSESPSFSPSTQALLIQSLLGRVNEVFTPAEMAQRLGYSAMTMTLIEAITQSRTDRLIKRSHSSGNRPSRNLAARC